MTPTPPRRGRGACSNIPGRFERWTRASTEDAPPEAGRLTTTVEPDAARTIITRNDSPDLPFSQSINPYRGCEHGCIYCYARPSHAYLGLSPGLDFETRLFAKRNAAELLRAELARPGYRCSPIALGANTDPYQPVERQWRVTREILEVLSDCHHPVTIVTKSALVERDLDLLAPMARRRLVRVYLSMTTLDPELARRLEPRAPAPQRRLQAMAALSEAHVPTGVLVAPVIPALTESELDRILDAAHAAGARYADYTLLRLPNEVKPLFKEWLGVHEPLKAEHVMSLIRQLRGGGENDTAFERRMRGEGVLAELLEQRFRLRCGRLGLDQDRGELDASGFRPPGENPQLRLF